MKRRLAFKSKKVKKLVKSKKVKELVKSKKIGGRASRSTTLRKPPHYALGFAACFARIMNYELLGWCCRAGRSTSCVANS